MQSYADDYKYNTYWLYMQWYFETCDFLIGVMMFMEYKTKDC